MGLGFVGFILLFAGFLCEDPDKALMFLGASGAIFVYLIARSILDAIELSKASRDTDLNAEEIPESRCPAHKWTYTADDYMVCAWCKKRPGQIMSDYDKPY